MPWRNQSNYEANSINNLVSLDQAMLVAAMAEANLRPSAAVHQSEVLIAKSPLILQALIRIVN